MKTFGERLRNLRIKKNLSQHEVSNIFNISPSAVGTYERGEREPSFDLLIKFSDFYKVSLDYLLKGKKEDEILLNRNLFFFDSSNLTNEELEEIKKYIEFVRYKSGKL